MTINVKDDSLKNQINKANPNQLADFLRLLGFGDMLRALPTYLRKKAPATPPVAAPQLATLQSFSLPDDAKACMILRAVSKKATAGSGELTIDAYGTTPIQGHIAVAPNGDIVMLTADAHLDVDVIYVPEKADVYELTLPVTGAAGLCALPAWLTARGAVTLLEAEVLAGTLLGPKIVLVPADGLPATTKAQLKVLKDVVQFAAADVVTSARIKVSVASKIDTDALMTASASFG